MPDSPVWGADFLLLILPVPDQQVAPQPRLPTQSLSAPCVGPDQILLWGNLMMTDWDFRLFTVFLSLPATF